MNLIWLKIQAVSLRTKIMGIVGLVTLTSALAIVWTDYLDMSTELREQLRERGVALASGLAAQSRDPMLTDNQFALYTLVRETIHADDDLTYIFALDTSGNVLVHTFDQTFPTDLLGKNPLQPGQAFNVQTLQTEDGTIQDVAVPIFGGKAGIVRLGMSEASIDKALDEHVRRVLLWTALILILGLYGAYGLDSFLVKPISRLAKEARTAGGSDPDFETPARTKDEVGILSDAFNQMSRELKRKEEMQEHLLGKVIAAQEEERKRIARELHDETSQTLTSLAVGLKYIEDSAEGADVAHKASDLRRLTAGMIGDVHRLAKELRPSLLDDLGLAAAVQRYVAEYSANTHIKADFQVTGFSGEHLSSEIEIAVFRIIQEALTNVAKHAEARNVSVVLMKRDSSVTAIVEDDGKGFDVDQTLNSSNDQMLGLFGMRERASLVGGQLTIESVPGTGTTVFVEVPFRVRE